MVTAMKALLQPLLLLASATDKELARQVQYLKEENRILRGKLPKRITVTPRERHRLVKFGRAVGSAIGELITIVSPRTFARWLSGEAGGKKADKGRPPGRPKTLEDVRALVLRLARETGWGYTRILGELKKLGVRVSRNTVANILRQSGFEPRPRRGDGTWDEFVRRHAATLWACDFFSKKVWTLGGLVDVFVLFFINVGTRRVHLAGLTARPDRAWVAQQARNMALVFADEPAKPQILLRDHDAKFVAEFDRVFQAEGIEVKRVGPRAPDLNAYAERWVQAVKQECLDRFVVFGQAHLGHILREYVEHHNEERPHQGRAILPLAGTEPDPGCGRWSAGSGWEGCCGTTAAGPPEASGPLVEAAHRLRRGQTLPAKCRPAWLAASAPPTGEYVAWPRPRLTGGPALFRVPFADRTGGSDRRVGTHYPGGGPALPRQRFRTGRPGVHVDDQHPATAQQVANVVEEQGGSWQRKTAAGGGGSRCGGPPSCSRLFQFPLRHSTARRSTCSVWLLVGSTPSTSTNVHSAGLTAACRTAATASA